MAFLLQEVVGMNDVKKPETVIVYKHTGIELGSLEDCLKITKTEMYMVWGHLSDEDLARAGLERKVKE